MRNSVSVHSVLHHYGWDYLNIVTDDIPAKNVLVLVSIPWEFPSDSNSLIWKHDDPVISADLSLLAKQVTSSFLLTAKEVLPRNQYYTEADLRS